MALKDSSVEMATTNIEPLDDPREKKHEHEQMQFMDRAPKAALASILSSWLYFGYTLKCLLDAQSGGLSGPALRVAWLSYLMQLGHASQSSCHISYACRLPLTDSQFPRVQYIC